MKPRRLELEGFFQGRDEPFSVFVIRLAVAIPIAPTAGVHLSRGGEYEHVDVVRILIRESAHRRGVGEANLESVAGGVLMHRDQ